MLLASMRHDQALRLILTSVSHGKIVEGATSLQTLDLQS